MEASFKHVDAGIVASLAAAGVISSSTAARARVIERHLPTMVLHDVSSRKIASPMRGKRDDELTNGAMAERWAVRKGRAAAWRGKMDARRGCGTSKKAVFARSARSRGRADGPRWRAKIGASNSFRAREYRRAAGRCQRRRFSVAAARPCGVHRKLSVRGDGE